MIVRVLGPLEVVGPVGPVSVGGPVPRRILCALLVRPGSVVGVNALIDAGKHLILESGHPSPLNRLGDFKGRRPFSRANAWLAERGIAPIDWRLP